MYFAIFLYHTSMYIHDSYAYIKLTYIHEKSHAKLLLTCTYLLIFFTSPNQTTKTQLINTHKQHQNLIK